MFKTLKDVKRRVVESTLEKVGASERTVDEEFDAHYAKFNTMMSDMNECGAALHTILATQKSYFNDGNELAHSLTRIHEQYSNPTFWPGTESKLESTEAAILYKEKMHKLHHIYRSSTSLVNLEQALEPLRQTIASVGPEIETMAKDRTTALIDYDSYRRRLKNYKDKRDQLEAAGKGNTPAAQENLADINKFENKEKNAQDLYEERNEKTKVEIIAAREKHDELMNTIILSTVICQAELFAAAARELEDVIKLLPQDKVSEVRSKIREVVSQGGVEPPPQEEKSKFQKGFAILTGKAVPSDFKKEKETAPTTSSAPQTASTPAATAPAQVSKRPSFFGSKPSSPPAASSTTTNAANTSKAANPFEADGNPFSAEEDLPKAVPVSTSAAPQAPVTRPVPPPAPPAAPQAPPAASKVLVEALYDHEAEADDELNFNAGDLVEVLETSEDGWWKGKCHGKIGLFPVNYVKQK